MEGGRLPIDSSCQRKNSRVAPSSERKKEAPLERRHRLNGIGVHLRRGRYFRLRRCTSTAPSPLLPVVWADLPDSGTSGYCRARGRDASGISVGTPAVTSIPTLGG